MYQLSFKNRWAFTFIWIISICMKQYFSSDPGPLVITDSTQQFFTLWLTFFSHYFSVTIFFSFFQPTSPPCWLFFSQCLEADFFGYFQPLFPCRLTFRLAWHISDAFFTFSQSSPPLFFHSRRPGCFLDYFFPLYIFLPGSILDYFSSTFRPAGPTDTSLTPAAANSETTKRRWFRWFFRWFFRWKLNPKWFGF